MTPSNEYLLTLFDGKTPVALTTFIDALFVAGIDLELTRDKGLRIYGLTLERMNDRQRAYLLCWMMKHRKNKGENNANPAL